VKDYTLPVRFLRSKEFTDFDVDEVRGPDDTPEQISWRELRRCDQEMLDINGNVRDEARYAEELGREAQPVRYVGEWLAMPPVDIFRGDGEAFEKRIYVYETEEERRNRVIVEESPPRQQDGVEGQRLMNRLVGAMNRLKEKYSGITWVEEDPNTNVLRRFWMVHDGLYAGWGNMDPRTTVEIKGRDEYFGIYRLTMHELR
jgi:hypothetical protein